MDVTFLYALLLAFGTIWALGQMIGGYDPIICILGLIIFSGDYADNIENFGLMPAAANGLAALGFVFAIGYLFFEKRFDGVWTVIGFLVFYSMLTPVLG